jgi:hypothetical protein
MKQQFKRSMIVGFTVLAMLMMVAAAAQACLVEHEPGARGDARGAGHFNHHTYAEPLPPVFNKHWAPSTAADDDVWEHPGRFWNSRNLGKLFWNMPDSHHFGWAPFGLFGAKWTDLFKEWDFSKLLDRMEESPAFVFFGGFMRPMFVAIVFPLAGNDNTPNGGGNGNNGTPTPIPASVLLLGTGLAGVGALRLKWRKAQG